MNVADAGTPGSATVEAPRANHEGERCPVWCAVDHATPYAVTPSGRELYLDVHGSDQIGGSSAHRVYLGLIGPGRPVEIAVSAPGTPRLALNADKAEALAAILGVIGLDGAVLADELRMAAAMARETAQ